MRIMNKTKKSIFNASIKVFSKYGYEGATMDEIAEEANVAKGTLYYHFKSKQEIFEYIIKKGMDIIKEEIDEVLEKQDSYLSKIRTICKVQLSLVYRDRDFFKVIMSQVWGQEIRNLKIREVIEGYIKFIKENLDKAMEAKEIKKGNTEVMAYSLFGNLCSAAVYELINKDIQNLDAVIDDFLDYILKGLEIK